MIEDSDTLTGLEAGLIVYVGFGFYSLIEPVVVNKNIINLDLNQLVIINGQQI